MFAILESKRKTYLIVVSTLTAAMASFVFRSKHNGYVTANRIDIIVYVV